MGLFDKAPTAKPLKGKWLPVADRKRWDKEEVKKLIKMWPDSTVEEICTALDRPASGVQNIVYSLRKLGVDMPRKGGFGDRPKLKEIIREVLDELKLPHN